MSSHASHARALGRAIRARRLELGASRADIASRLGLDPVSFAQIEQGIADPDVDRLRTLALVLDTNLTTLFTRAEELLRAR